MTNFLNKIPLARDSTPDDPRSYWDKLLMEEQRAKATAYAAPTQVTVDPSCDYIPATKDPSVQRAALAALNRSMHDEAAGKAEHGFYASENIFGDGYSVGPDLHVRLSAPH